MLNIIEYGKDEYAFPSLLVLGCFDGIHIGHRELFKKAKLQAKINGLDLGVMMFRDGKGGRCLYSFEERVALLSPYNVKFVLAVDFTEEFKKTSPLDFLHNIEDKLNVKAYMSGKDFRFGANAKGKSSTLKNYADDEENGVWYQSVKDVVSAGEKVSTTTVKSCLDVGNVAKANILLGKNFFVEGDVVKGAGRGASVLGYPTVNLVYPEEKYPLKEGVYRVVCRVDEKEYRGIANYGDCPTFGDERKALEVNLDGFDGDLYGARIKVEFVDYLRDIVKFGSAEDLARQLAADKQSLNDSGAAAEDTHPEEESAPSVQEQATAPDAAAEQSAEEGAATCGDATPCGLPEEEKERAEVARDTEIGLTETETTEEGSTGAEGDLESCVACADEECAVAEPTAEADVSSENEDGEETADDGYDETNGETGNI